MVTNVKRVTLTVQGDFDLDDCTPNDPAKINWKENQKQTSSVVTNTENPVEQCFH